jgi:hypothetical protein
MADQPAREQRSGQQAKVEAAAPRTAAGDDGEDGNQAGGAERQQGEFGTGGSQDGVELVQDEAPVGGDQDRDQDGRRDEAA